MNNVLQLPEPHVQREEHGLLSLKQEAIELRRDIVQTLFLAGGGHYGGSLSVVDILHTLYRRSLRILPRIPRHPARDRCILSKGHAAIALYAILHRLGFFDMPLAGYAEFPSILEGHPDMNMVPGVDFSTGSLGQGLSVGIGMALALRNKGQRVWVVLGDGECQEGQVWEAAMLASQCALDNIFAIIDCNHFQEWGWAINSYNPHSSPVPNMALKWKAFGWDVIECDGHDHTSIEDAITISIQKEGQPSVILAQTKKGKGVPLIENDPQRFHCGTVDTDEYLEILKSLEQI